MSECLPELSLLLLGGDFDHSRLVNDPRSSLTLLNNADNPGLITLLFLNVL